MSDVIACPLIIHANPCALATESTDMVIKLKIATVLACLIWRELNGQSWRLCQEVKEECFALVAGQCIEKLLEVARSFSDKSWCACPVKDMLAIFDALFDVLHNIQRLPLKKYDELAGISSKMVDAFSAVLEGTIGDTDSREGHRYTREVGLQVVKAKKLLWFDVKNQDVSCCQRKDAVKVRHVYARAHAILP